MDEGCVVARWVRRRLLPSLLAERMYSIYLKFCIIIVIMIVRNGNMRTCDVVCPGQVVGRMF